MIIKAAFGLPGAVEAAVHQPHGLPERAGAFEEVGGGEIGGAQPDLFDEFFHRRGETADLALEGQEQFRRFGTQPHRLGFEDALGTVGAGLPKLGGVNQKSLTAGAAAGGLKLQTPGGLDFVQNCGFGGWDSGSAHQAASESTALR